MELKWSRRSSHGEMEVVEGRFGSYGGCTVPHKIVFWFPVSMRDAIAFSGFDHITCFQFSKFNCWRNGLLCFIV